MILTIVSSTSCATPFSCGVLNIAQSGCFQSGQHGLTALLVNGYPAWQCGGDAHVFIQHFLGLLWLTHLEEQAFAGELRALLRYGFFEVVTCIMPK